MPSFLGNFPNIQRILQIPRHSGNSPDSQVFREFSRFPGIWEFSNFDNFFNRCPSLQLVQDFKVSLLKKLNL